MDGAPLGLSGRFSLFPARLRLRRWPVEAIRSSWGTFPLERRFLIIAVLSVGMAMAGLGYWIEQRVRAGWIQAMAETSALYMEGFLAPHVQGLEPGERLSRESQEKIESLLVNTSLAKRVAIINVWDLEGKLLLTTDKSGLYKPDTKLDRPYFSPIVDKTRAGGYVANFDRGDHLIEINRKIFPQKFFEVYAPLHDYGSREVIAIGEFYEFSSFAKKEILAVRASIWFLVLATGLIISFILHLIMRRARAIISAKQCQLEMNAARAAALAKRNAALRRAADRARLSAVVLNEAYLARVGADIHDGPIQVLTLMMLKLPRLRGAKPPSEAALALRYELEPLIRLAQSELRNLSGGLALPEVQQLSIAETIEFAIKRHEQQTGTVVGRDVGSLPSQTSNAVRVCSYRVIQEGLTNAFKHAAGNGQKVSARFAGGMLEIAVSDTGQAGARAIEREEGRSPLGLNGMESRVKALRGGLTIDRQDGGGTQITVTLPLRP